MNYTINEIPDEAVELSGNEMIPIWQGETKKVSVATLAGYVQDASSYSTTETLTGGKWIDGKPIYRKVVTNLSVSISDMIWTNICSQSLFPNSESLISCDAISNTSFMRVAESYFSDGYLKIETPTGGARTIQTVIVEYTKTTD